MPQRRRNESAGLQRWTAPKLRNNNRMITQRISRRRHGMIISMPRSVFMYGGNDQQRAYIESRAARARYLFGRSRERWHNRREQRLIDKLLKIIDGCEDKPTAFLLTANVVAALLEQ